MAYLLFLKNNIAMAKACRKTNDNVELGVYDRYVEVTLKEYNTIELPSEKIDGVWVKTNNIPKIEYPDATTPETPKITTEDILNTLLGVTE